MQYHFLSKINSPDDLKKLSETDLPILADELRDFIIDVVATKEGHLGASLGVVELTIALHYIFDTPKDLLIWDVGHQAYGHKILTGRRATFHTNRQWGGISGFPKREESPYDAFGTGHSSTSISAILGMGIASLLQGDETKQHIAVIGDASIASGMAFEGLNHLGVSNANVLVILNDNAIGIDPSVGALKNYLTQVKKGENIKQNNIIQALNIRYFGPIDGHDLPKLLRELRRLKKIKGPKFLHLITTKGKGLKQAEQDQVKYHAPGKFDKQTGQIIAPGEDKLPPKYQDVFGETLLELALKNEKIVGITPAMPTGSSLKIMMDALPHRAFDVGIAEQHAVTLSAGMATQGMLVFCNIYSTFLQRAFDQIVHDVALQNLPVVFCLDRAGIVGEDGATHHGAFDIAYLRCIPNLTVFAPLDEIELRQILYTVSLGISGPIAIRYPRGRGVHLEWKKDFEKVTFGKAHRLHSGSDIAVLSTGHIGNLVSEAIENLPEKDSKKVSHFHFGFIKPINIDALREIAASHRALLTVEDGCVTGGFGAAVLEELATFSTLVKTTLLGLPDRFLPHGTVAEVQDFAGISKEKILEKIQAILK
ncbi:MAG: 1-deoxy-D-xylulose-5-phosphate synthase [Flavobacteriaceae bacterium]|nr:1-deoxy-D-xylulose-5-phosphate synthase [Flavobacteriaceae bacterium]